MRIQKNSIPISTQYVDYNIHDVNKDNIIQSGTTEGKSYSICQYLSNIQTTKQT
jgi:hypothetical protein